MRVHSVPSLTRGWRLPGLWAVLAAKDQTALGSRGLQESPPSSWFEVGSPHPSALAPSPSFFPLLGEGNPSRFPFPVPFGPRSPAPRLPRSPAPAGFLWVASGGRPKPQSQCLPRAVRALGSSAPLRSQVWVSLAPSDFAQQPLRVAGAPGVARRQAAAEADSTRPLPPHLPRPLCSPLALGDPSPPRSSRRDHPDSPRATRRRWSARSQAEPGRPPARGPPPAPARSPRPAPAGPSARPRCRGGRDLPPGQGDPAGAPRRPPARLGSPRACGAPNGAAPASAPQLPSSLLLCPPPSRPPLRAAPRPAPASRAPRCPARAGARG